MKLSRLLGVEKGVTALIGGGGKTTLLYHLAEELRSQGTVLVCTTTKIWPPQHLPVAQSLESLQEILRRDGIACAGTPTDQGKLTAPSFPWETAADYVLVEADGAAGSPFKAHEAWEPVVPQKCRLRILVAGASGFGQPIAQAAHRPALYARLSGVTENAAITPEIAARVVNREALHDHIFLNQMDDEQDRVAAHAFARLVDCPVIAGTLQGDDWERLR